MYIDNFAVRTLYAELLDLCQAQQFEALPLSVSFTTKTVSGQLYHYAQFQDLHAGKQRQVYLGPDNGDLRVRIERYRERQHAVEVDAGPRRALVRAILAAGGQGPDGRSGRLFQFLDELGVFRVGGVVVGSHVYACYINRLGVRLPSYETQDVDVAAPLQVAFGSPPEPMELALRRFDANFIPVPELAGNGTAPSTSFRIRGAQLRLDLLTPLLGRPGRPVVEVSAFGGYATPVRYLDYLTEQTQSAVLLTGAGVLINAPQPERYALHKLIVASARPAAMRAKRDKDLLQASTLIEWFLENEPEDLQDAASALLARNDGWRKHVERSVSSLSPRVRQAMQEMLGTGAG